MGCEVYFTDLPKEEIDKIRESNKEIRIPDFKRKQDCIKYEILFNLQSLKKPRQKLDKFTWFRIDTLYGLLLFNITYLAKCIEAEFDCDFVERYDNDDLYFCGRQFTVNKGYMSVEDFAKIYTRNILNSLLNNKKFNSEEIEDILDVYHTEITENRTYYYLDKFKEYKEVSD